MASLEGLSLVLDRSESLHSSLHPVTTKGTIFRFGTERKCYQFVWTPFVGVWNTGTSTAFVNAIDFGPCLSLILDF